MDNNYTTTSISSSYESTSKFNRIFDPRSYSVRGKIMLSSVSILFFVIILMLILHLYARWYLLTTRRQNRRIFLRHRLQQQQEQQQSSTGNHHHVFYVDSNNPTELSNNHQHRRGLDASIVSSLPIFKYDAKAFDSNNNNKEENAPDCAVCLSEFQEGETGRVLPRCNHAFHTACIDMWFHSHSTCPLCRAPVQGKAESKRERENNNNNHHINSDNNNFEEDVVVIRVGDELGTSSDSVLNENRICSEVSTSARKPSLLVGDVTFEIHERGEGVEIPEVSSSRSPMTRGLSLLSRERRGSVPPSPCSGSTSAAELNAERGGHDETQ